MTLSIVKRIRRSITGHPETPFNLGFQQSPSWDARAACAARLAAGVMANLPARPSYAVADVGCGDRKLAGHLLGHWPHRLLYDGYDLRPQSPAVVTFDARTDSFPRRYDLTFLLGVLEYIERPMDTLARALDASSHVCVSITLQDRLHDRESTKGRSGWCYLPTLAQWHDDIASIAGRTESLEFIDDDQVAVTIVTR